MRYIKFTYVDAVTGAPVSEAPALNGPVFPAVAGLEFGWARESQYPTAVPEFFGTCPEDSDIAVPGVLGEYIEADWLTMRDDEMRARIALHQSRRGPEWINHAEPLDLLRMLRETDDAPRLVDCLTLWLTNLILGDHDWRAYADALVAELPAQRHPVVFVTNEVGGGIVPDNALARAFRDAAGALNQQVAAAADEVVLAVCGLPLRVK